MKITLGLASCQPSPRFRKRPYLKGLRKRVIEQETQCLPRASMYKGTGTAYMYTRWGAALRRKEEVEERGNEVKSNLRALGRANLRATQRKSFSPTSRRNRTVGLFLARCLAYSDSTKPSCANSVAR